MCGALEPRRREGNIAGVVFFQPFLPRSYCKAPGERRWNILTSGAGKSGGQRRGGEDGGGGGARGSLFG